MISAYDTVGSDPTVRLDFWKTQGKRFAAVLSAQSDSVLVYHLVIGRYLAAGNELEFYYAGHNLTPIVTGEARATYLEYLRTGELGRLFEAGRFWEDESSWEELYNRTGLIVGAGNFYRPHAWLGAHDILPHRAKGRKTVPTERDVWLLQIGFLAAQDGVVVEDTLTEKEYPTCGADFLVFYDNWFGAIESRYHDTGIIYRPIVGQHMADSILYRYIGDSVRVLGGDDVKIYRRLAEHDSLWSLVGPLEMWQDRAALEQLWQESQNRGRPDSSATQTKVLRLGPPPKK